MAAPLHRVAWLVLACALAAPAAAEERRLTPEVEARIGDSLRSSGSLKVRLQAAIVLGRAGTSAAMPALVAALDDDHHGVRAAAALALGNLGDPAALRPLVEHADDPDGFVRDHVRDAIRTFRTPAALPALLAAAELGSGRGKTFVIETVAGIDAPESDAAIGGFLGDPEDAVREAVERALASFYAARRDRVLRAAIDGTSESVRAAAVAAAARTRATGVIDALVTLARTETDSEELPNRAKRALWELRDELDGATLSARIRGEGSPEQRARALLLIGIRGGADARDLLLVGLGDADPQVRVHAARGLVDLGDVGGAREVRLAAAKEEDERVRRRLEAVAAVLERGLRPAWRDTTLTP